MPTFDTVIKGGTVIDGLRTPRYRADVGIRDGRIAQIGRIPTSDANEAIDASGASVSRKKSSSSDSARPPSTATPDSSNFW